GFICMGMNLAGLGIRTQYRVQHFGWHNSINTTVDDSIITAMSVVAGYGMYRGGRAAEKGAERNPVFKAPSTRFDIGVGVVTNIPDFVQIIMNWAPGVDANFFTNP